MVSRNNFGDLSLTVITVVLNDVKHIEETMLSVVGQECGGVEYIVVDGGSTDGTADIVKKYEKYIDCYISGPDDGIYDAMNKGVSNATGKWVCFINSGDYFLDNKVVCSLRNDLSGDWDIVYGDVELRCKGQKFIKRAGDIKDLWKGMITPHQSIFVRRELLVQSPHDLSYKLSADYCFLYLMYFQGKMFKHVDLVVSSCEYCEGVSSQYPECAVIERRDILRAIREDNQYDFYYAFLYCAVLVKKWFKKVLPVSLVKKIMAMKAKYG